MIERGKIPAGLIAVLVVGVFLIPLILYTTEEISSGRETVLVRVNRLTGAATYYRMADADRAAQRPSGPTASALPQEEREKLTGRAGPDSNGKFSGTLYNGTNWRITSVTIGIEFKEADKKKTRWNRAYRAEVSIPPLAVGDFGFEVFEGFELYEAYSKDRSRAEWTIHEAMGIPPE